VKYVPFLEALVSPSAGTFPVGHTAELGPQIYTRSHAGMPTASLISPTNRNNRPAMLWYLGEAFCEFFEDTWKRLTLFGGGYFDAQYPLWTPGPITRMQGHATAACSPRLYRKFVQPADRMIAARFPNNCIHPHLTSMFLLDAFLEIEEIRCFKINLDASGLLPAAMIPHWQKVQSARKPLLIPDYFTASQLRVPPSKRSSQAGCS
jgi:hypothetical protein